MATFPYPTLDSISAFIRNGDDTTTATVSFTNTYAPSYTNGTSNIYGPNQLIYITGADSSDNNGTFTIASSTASTITYSNSNGVTHANEFALCSSTPGITGTSDPVVVYAAQPFQYTYSTTPPTFNPPPAYTSTSYPTVYTADSLSSGGTTRTTLLGGTSSFALVYPNYSLRDLYPYKFSPSITIPYIQGTVNGGFSYDNDATYCEVYGGAYPTGSPRGMALDRANGILYVIDTGASTIRKVTLATKSFVTIAGASMGTPLTGPYGIAFDSLRNCLYVSDALHIQQINLAVTPCTMTAILTDTDGNGYSGMVIDPTQTYLYIANTNKSTNATITRITLGTTPTALRLNINVSNPIGLAMNASGTLLYIVTSKLGLYSSLLESPFTLSTWHANLSGSTVYSADIACDDVNSVLYLVSSLWLGRIYKYSTTPPGTAFTYSQFFDNPKVFLYDTPTQHVVFDNTARILYISYNITLRSIVVDLFIVKTLNSTPLAGLTPTHLAIQRSEGTLSSGYIFAAESSQFNLVRLITSGTPSGVGSLPLYSPAVGIVFNSTSTVLYCVCVDGSIAALPLTSVVPGATIGYVPGTPSAITIDNADTTLYVTSTTGDIWSVLISTGEVTLIVSTGDVMRGIVYDSSSSVLYVTRVYSGGSKISIFTLGGVETSYIDTGSGNYPYGLALDATAGILYYSDYSSNIIRYVTLSTNAITTLAGSGSAAETDGAGTAAAFNCPAGIVLDWSRTRLYVADFSGHTVRVIDVTDRALTPHDVLGGTLAGNVLTIAGVQHTYTSPITLRCTPTGSNAFTLDFNGVTGPTINSNFVQMIFNVVSVSPPVDLLTFEYNAPLPIVSHADTQFPYAVLESTDASGVLLNYTFSNGESALSLEDAVGFTSIPSPTTLNYTVKAWVDYAYDYVYTISNTFTVNRIPITATPLFTSPLSLYTYAAFSYVFALPDEVTNVILDGTASTSTSLLPYVSYSFGNSVVTFSGNSVTPLTGNLNIYAYVAGHTDVLGSNLSLASILPSYTVGIPPGTFVTLYKYEPFSYVFTVNGGSASSLTIRYTNSSAQLVVFSSLSSDGRTFTFAGTPVASYANTFSLVVELLDGTTVLNSVTYPVTISAGRVTFLPASPYAMNQYENISNTFGSNIVCTSANSPDSIIAVPVLPTGLSFSNISNIVGIPRTQQAQKNYQIIASNSLNGSISTGAIAISVGVPVVRIFPPSASFSGLTPTGTFTALVPSTIYSSSFAYMWTPSLPSGLVFTDISNTPLPNLPFYPTDPSKTIKLAGTADMTDAFGFPSSGLVTVTLSGYYKDATNVQTIGTSVLSFQFAETVLMTTSVSSTMYVGKALGSNDVVITARSYFPSTSAISNFTVPGLPDGLSVAGSGPWHLAGTPTSAGTTSTTASAVNFHGISNSTPLTFTINPDIVTFTQTPANPTFTVSLPIVGNEFQVQAVATSGSAITYTSSVNLATYGLSLNSVTGVVSGVPILNFGPGLVVFTATDALGASATYSNTAFTIQRDVFTWPAYAPTYFQNRVVTPYQITVSTLSGRAIQSFTSANMPPGLSLSPSGLITGTFTGATNSTFTVTATTGYQSPITTASQTYSYIAKADNLLILLANGTDPISNTFSNVQFASVQYSSDTLVNATYAITGTYPLQYPEPLLTISPSGSMSGDFTGVAGPYPTYLVDVESSYNGVTSTVTSVLSLGNTPTPFMLAGVTKEGWSTIPQTISTTSYVFNATTSGTHSVTNQSWGGSGLPFGQVFSSEFLYPDIGRIGTGFVAVTESNVFDGIYDPTTGGVNWTENTPTQYTPVVDRFGCVANNGVNEWLLVQMSSPIVSFSRSGTSGPWTQNIADLNSPSTNASNTTTMSYINGTYVFGQASNASYRNILYTSNRRSWNHPTTPPTFSNILRFATSNDTLVAVGCNAPSDTSPISYSVDYGINWSMPTVPEWMQGPNVVFRDIAYAKNTWVICGSIEGGSNIIAYSADLTNWQLYPDTGDIEWSALAFNGNAWTVAGSYYNPTSEQYETRVLSLDAGTWPDQATSMSVSPFLLADSSTTGVIRFSRLVTGFFSNTSSFTGTAFIPPGPLTFTQPTQSTFVLYQHVPYTIPVAAVTTTDFIFYYASGLPVGLQFVLDPTGTFATITGSSPSNGLTNATVYAKTANSAATAYRLSLNTVIPYFTNPQVGAAAYTAILREHVNADAAQNARDSQVFPQVNPLAGPFMAPRAPDVATQTNCFLKLCKKPCPTCKSAL